MKPLYLLDTSIISEVFKPRPNAGVLESFQDRMERCALSSISRQELVYGMERLLEGKRKELLRHILDELFDWMEVLSYDTFAARICGELLAGGEAAGISSPICDIQIASVAIANNMILVTHNLGDFLPLAQRSLLKVEDWWS